MLLRRERHPVGVALSLDLGRLAVPLEPADRGAVADELVVVELRPAEPGPPLGPRLALVVVEQVREQPPRLALLGADEQPRLQGLACGVSFLGLFRRRALVGRQPPRHGGRPDRAQPLVQLERRAAVLLVVALDLFEDRVVARLDPLLEANDRLVAARHLGRALEPVELLDRLDRVAVGRGPQRLLDDAVEVDQHLLAQEVVDLLLPRSVLAGEAGQGRALVRGVVVDVHPRVLRTARDDPVDELLERDALVVAVSPPHRVVDDLAGVVAEAVAEEVLEPARGLVERMALHVEPDVARVGRGQQPEAALLLVGEELEQVAVFAPPSQLQLGLVAGAFEGVGVGVRRKPAGQGRRCQVAELLERGDTRGDQRLGLRAPQPATSERWSSSTRCCQHMCRKSQIPQWLVGQPYVSWLVGDRGEEPLADAPVVRLELDDPERLALAEPVLDVHVLDGPAGDPRDLLGVEQQLQHVRRLGAAGELRVDGLVAAVGLQLEEVAEPAPRSRR